MNSTTSNIGWEFEFAWPFPVIPTVIAIAVALCWLSWGYRRFRRGSRSSAWLMVFRLTAGLVMLLAIGRLGWRCYAWQPPRLLLLVDDSHSMSWEDALTRDDPTHPIDRWTQAQSLLAGGPASLLQQIVPDWDVQIELLSGTVLAGAGELQVLDSLRNARPELDHTPLGDRLRELLSLARGELPRAVLTFTDGNQNRGRPMAAAAVLATQLRVPLHFVCLGGQHPVRDAQLKRLVVERQAFWGDEFPVRLDVRVQGLEGHTLTADVRHARRQRVLASKTWTSHKDEARSLELFVTADEPGELPLEVVIRTDATERDEENNRRTATVRVSDQRLRALLIATRPSYEYRSLKESLGRRHAGERSAIGLSSVLFSADPRIEQTDPQVRSQLKADWTRDVDCVILCDVEPDQFTAERQQQLYQHVSDDGAGAILIAGPRAIPGAFLGKPLSRLLPAEFSPTAEVASDSGEGGMFQFLPTRLGRSLAAMRFRSRPESNADVWRELAALTWAIDMPPLRRDSRVLAVRVPTEASGVNGSPGQPVAVLQFVGAGRTLFHATDETWRWQIRRGDREFVCYWLQMIRYLSRGRLAGRESLSWNTDQPEYIEGEAVRLRAVFDKENITTNEAESLRAQIKDTSGSAIIDLPLQPVSLRRGVWQAATTTLPPGQYVATLGYRGSEFRCAFRVLSRQPEREFLSPDPSRLALAARQTGGQLFSAENLDRLAAWFREHQSATPRPLEFRPLLRPWQIALLVCGFLVIEWVLQRW